MRKQNSSSNPSLHLLAQLRLRNYFAYHLTKIIKKSFYDDDYYPEFEKLLNAQNNFEVVNYLLILTDTYRNNPNLLNILIDILKKN